MRPPYGAPQTTERLQQWLADAPANPLTPDDDRLERKAGFSLLSLFFHFIILVFSSLSLSLEKPWGPHYHLLIIVCSRTRVDINHVVEVNCWTHFKTLSKHKFHEKWHFCLTIHFHKNCVEERTTYACEKKIRGYGTFKRATTNACLKETKRVQRQRYFVTLFWNCLDLSTRVLPFFFPELKLGVRLS